MTNARTLTTARRGRQLLRVPALARRPLVGLGLLPPGASSPTTPTGARRPCVEVEGQPSGLGWLPDGDLLVVSMKDRRVLRRAADGTVSVHADVSALTGGHLNDMIVDRHGPRLRRQLRLRPHGRRPPGDGRRSCASTPTARAERRRRGPLVPQRHGHHRRRHADRRRDLRPPASRPSRSSRRHADRSARLGPGPAHARAGRHGDDARRRHLRARRLRAGRRGARLGGQRARRRALPRRPRRADRRGGRDAGRPRRVRVRRSAARTAAR